MELGIRHRELVGSCRVSRAQTRKAALARYVEHMKPVCGLGCLEDVAQPGVFSQESRSGRGTEPSGQSRLPGGYLPAQRVQPRYFSELGLGLLSSAPRGFRFAMQPGGDTRVLTAHVNAL